MISEEYAFSPCVFRWCWMRIHGVVWYQIWNLRMWIGQHWLVNPTNWPQMWTWGACAFAGCLQNPDSLPPCLRPNRPIRSPSPDTELDHQFLEKPHARTRCRRRRHPNPLPIQQLCDAKITNNVQRRADSRKWWNLVEANKVSERQRFPFSKSNCRYYEQNERQTVEAG